MGYMHIDNLYKAQDILLFKECYALEKIHGTSAHLTCNSNNNNGDAGDLVKYFSGGESQVNFEALFNKREIDEHFRNLKESEAIIYGEAYGGSQQGMSYLYGKTLKFIVFDILINNRWLDVPNAERLAKAFGLEFVHYVKIPATIEALEKERDSDSVQAVRNGVDLTKLPEGRKPIREGVVLRPLVEMYDCFGNRIISKHKSDEFNKERATPQKVVDASTLKILSDANEVANEWVTDMRLAHVLQKLPSGSMELVPKLIPAMVEDVLREGAGEIVDSKEVRKAIGKKAVELFKKKLESSIGLNP